MRNRPASWVIAALLMVQFAAGLPWQAAHAAVVPAESGHCPGHAGAISAPFAHTNPANKHDCCGSQGCQCHCAQSHPVVRDLWCASAASGLRLLPVVDAKRPVTLSTELFRPPIA
jgi:hypothetical protein